MHIAEGIITGVPALVLTAVSIGLVGVGASKMKKFVEEHPEKKPLLGMAAAFIFFLSLIPLPAFTGTTSHPCGTPLIGILLGPWIGIALSGLTLLLQAAFFAHGGFSTWGANVITLGVGGAFFGWLFFKVLRKARLPLFVAAAIGGLMGDVMTYVIAGLELGTFLSFAEGARYSMGGYLTVIYGAYLPTQGPIAIGEMILTGSAVHSIKKQKPDILISLKVIAPLLILAVVVSVAQPSSAYAQESHTGTSETGNIESNVVPVLSTHQHSEPVEESEEESELFGGMDGLVNSALAVEAGTPPRDQYINLEQFGELWSALMMLTGCLCGFIIGRSWDTLFGKSSSLQACK